MMTFHFQDRTLMHTGGSKKIEFPNPVKLVVELGPGEAFGTAHGMSRLVIQSQETNLVFDAKTGRVQSQSKPGLASLDVSVEYDDGKFIFLKGNVLTFEADCENEEELEKYLNAFTHLLPIFLNLYFADPPVILDIEGQLGKFLFRCQHKVAVCNFSPKTSEAIEKHVADSFKYFGISDYRLLASLHYFYLSCRLAVAGHSQWEFMAEIILNFCKVLQALFGESMDDVRKGLANIGYSSEEIETDFIPIMVLRSSFNVGHIQISVPRSDQLQILYKFLMLTEEKFRELLMKVVSKVENGELVLSERKDLKLGNDEQKKFDRIIDTIKDRVSHFG